MAMHINKSVKNTFTIKAAPTEKLLWMILHYERKPITTVKATLFCYQQRYVNGKQGRTLVSLIVRTEVQQKALLGQHQTVKKNKPVHIALSSY